MITMILIEKSPKTVWLIVYFFYQSLLKPGAALQTASSLIIDRPGVAGAVLQTASSLIN